MCPDFFSERDQKRQLIDFGFVQKVYNVWTNKNLLFHKNFI